MILKSSFYSSLRKKKKNLAQNLFQIILATYLIETKQTKTKIYKQYIKLTTKNNNYSIN